MSKSNSLYMSELEKAHETTEKGFRDTPVRFFTWGSDPDQDEEELDEGAFNEVSEAEFLEAEGVIEYERHTVFENGCSQICLTKNPFGKG